MTEERIVLVRITARDLQIKYWLMAFYLSVLAAEMLIFLVLCHVSESRQIEMQIPRTALIHMIPLSA